MNCLITLNSHPQVNEALTLADGNPRLLEFLNEKLNQSEQELNRLKDYPDDLRQQVLTQELLEQVDQPLQKLLALGLVFQLPVPRTALEKLCAEKIDDPACYIDRAIALGLLEVSNKADLRVPRILPFKLVSNLEVVHAQAAQILDELWCSEAATATEKQKLEVHRLALEGKVEEIATNITIALVVRWQYQSRFREAMKLCKSTLEIVRDYRILHQLAQTEAELGELDNALNHLEEALNCCTPEDANQKAAILYEQALINLDKGNLEKAKSLYKQSQEIQNNIENDKLKAATLNGLAAIYDQEGKIEEALNHYNQALEIQRGIKDCYGEAATLHRLAGIHTRQGSCKEAIRLYSESLKIKEDKGDIKGEAETLQQLAGIYAQQGDIKKAIDSYFYALDLQQQIEHLQGQAATLLQLAGIYAYSGEVEIAIERCRQVLSIHERLDDPKGKAGALRLLTGIYARQGQLKEAIEYGEEALKIEKRIAHAQGKATTLAMLGQLLASEEQFAESLAHLQEAQSILQELGSPDAEEVGQIISEVQQRAGD